MPSEVSRRRKLATVLFCDVAGSTALGEIADAETVRDLMSRYFDEMRTAIEGHGGTVEKFIGDAVVAVFGVPTAHEDDALRATRAAHEMRERAASLNDEFEQRFGARISVRIGLNTGEVVSGDAASRETFVTGDAVNVAARLEQQAAPGDILLGEATHHLVRDAVVAETMAPLAVKGKEAPLAVHRLVAVQLPHGRPVRRAEARFVGREHEAALVSASLAEAFEQRECRLFTIVGEPGMGKSRLAAEVTRRVGTRATVLEGRCLSYGEGITYWPLAEVIRSAAQIHDQHSPDEARARLDALLSNAAAAAHLGRLLGLAEGASTPAEIALSVRALLSVLSADRPLLLLVDDIQWAEPALLDLLSDLPTSVAAPVLVLCLARPELLDVRPAWTPCLHLDPLDDDTSADLLNEIVGGSFPADMRARVAAASGGNPLFLEEFAGMLVAAGLLVRTNGSWSVAPDVADFPVPVSITALLGARLDRLEDGVRRVLESGAIEGEAFHRRAVVALSPDEEEPAVRAALEVLSEQGLIHPAPASFMNDAAFRFHHLLLRDAAYHAIPKRSRADLHARFADWLERSAGERVPEYEEIVGYHLEQSYRHRLELGPVDDIAQAIARRAAAHLGAAGHRAGTRGDLLAADRLLERALALGLADDAVVLDLAVDLLEAKLGCGDYTGARRVLDHLGDDGSDRRSSAYRDVYLGYVEQATLTDGGYDTADIRADRAIAAFESLSDSRGLGKAWALRFWALWNRGELTKAREAGERSLAHASRAGDTAQAADGMKMIAGTLAFGPTPLSACADLLERWLTEANVRANLLLEGEVMVQLGVIRSGQGRFEEGRALATAGEERLLELGDYVLLASFNPFGQIAVLEDDAAEAERRYRAAVETLEALGNRGELSTAAFQLAGALYELGRLEEAWRFLEKSRSYGAGDDVVTQTGWRAVASLIVADQGGISLAERLARQAVALIEKTEYVDEHAMALVNLAHVLRLAGDSPSAREALAKAVSLWDSKENVVYAGRARRRLSELDPVPPPLDSSVRRA